MSKNTEAPEDKNAHLAAPSPTEHGGRVELRLAGEATKDATEVVYNARWFTPGHELEGRVVVLISSKIRSNVEAPEALPEWLGSFTSKLMNTSARQAVKDGAWPRRLTRWRDAPK